MASCKVSALCMLLIALAVSSKAQEWQSGEINTHDTFLYGALEARIKAASGPSGVTGILFIVPAAGVGDEWQELAFEMFGKDSTLYQTQILLPGPQEEDPTAEYPRTQKFIQKNAPSSLHDEFHTYRIEWTPDYLAFFLDGDEVRRETDRDTYAKFFDRSRVAEMDIRFVLWAGFSDWSGHMDESNPPNRAQAEYISYESYDEDSGEFNMEWKDDFDSFDYSRWKKVESGFPHALNDFDPANVQVSDGVLTLHFTRAGAAPAG